MAPLSGERTFHFECSVTWQRLTLQPTPLLGLEYSQINRTEQMGDPAKDKQREVEEKRMSGDLPVLP